MIGKIITLLTALAALVERFFSIYTERQRRREEDLARENDEEFQREVDRLHEDPAQWFSDHFSSRTGDGVRETVSGVSGGSEHSAEADPDDHPE